MRITLEKTITLDGQSITKRIDCEEIPPEIDVTSLVRTLVVVLDTGNWFASPVSSKK